MFRGAVQISDINRNIKKVKEEVDMVKWNKDGFKIGLCKVPPLNQPYSLLNLSNNCCVKTVFEAMRDRFLMIFKKDFYLHHYTNQGLSKEQFKEALESIETLITQYDELEIKNKTSGEVVKRFRPDVD